MKLLNLIQNTPEWEMFRNSHVGASDVGVLMEGSEREVYDLLKSKRGLKERYESVAMRRGSDMEAEAVEWLTGQAPDKKETALHNQPDDWLMASFDYIDMINKKGAEIKCPLNVLDRPSEHTHYKRWWWQIQAQMAVSGYKSWELIVYHPSKQTWEIIARDDEAIEKLKIKGRWFHDILINFGELPKPQELPHRSEEQILDWASYFRAVDEKIKALEEEKQVLRDEGIALAGEEGFECNGVKVQKIQTRQVIDYEAACKKHGIDVSSFVKIPKNPYTWRISAS